MLFRSPVICESSGTDSLTVLAAKSADGARKGFLVTDYRNGGTEIVVKVDGVADGAPAKAWVHDYTRDREEIPVQVQGGQIVLRKADTNSAAFLVTF